MERWLRVNYPYIWQVKPFNSIAVVLFTYLSFYLFSQVFNPIEKGLDQLGFYLICIPIFIVLFFIHAWLSNVRGCWEKYCFIGWEAKLNKLLSRMFAVALLGSVFFYHSLIIANYSHQKVNYQESDYLLAQKENFWLCGDTYKAPEFGTTMYKYLGRTISGLRVQDKTFIEHYKDDTSKLESVLVLCENHSSALEETLFITHYKWRNEDIRIKLKENLEYLNEYDNQKYMGIAMGFFRIDFSRFSFKWSDVVEFYDGNSGVINFSLLIVVLFFLFRFSPKLRRIILDSVNALLIKRPKAFIMRKALLIEEKLFVNDDFLLKSKLLAETLFICYLALVTLLLFPLLKVVFILFDLSNFEDVSIILSAALLYVYALSVGLLIGQTKKNVGFINFGFEVNIGRMFFGFFLAYFVLGCLFSLPIIVNLYITQKATMLVVSKVFWIPILASYFACVSNIDINYSATGKLYIVVVVLGAGLAFFFGDTSLIPEGYGVLAGATHYLILLFMAFSFLPLEPRRRIQTFHITVLLVCFSLFYILSTLLDSYDAESTTEDTHYLPLLSLLIFMLLLFIARSFVKLQYKISISPKPYKFNV